MLKRDNGYRSCKATLAWCVLFGLRLNEARVRAGLTQKTLARHAGCTREHVERLENGRRRPGAFMTARLAQVLEVSADWLLGLRSYP